MISVSLGWTFCLVTILHCAGKCTDRPQLPPGSLVEVFSVTQCDLLNAGTIVTNYLR